MLYQNRDRDLNLIRGKGHACYGMGLGVMLLSDTYPGSPGDLRNASAFPYPVQYEVADVSAKTVVVGDKSEREACVPQIIEAAKKLQSMGCKAITAECGFFSFFQKEIAGALDVPVFMSSLLQVPFIQQVIGPKKSVGIVCVTRWALTDDHLANVGIDLNSNYVITGGTDDNNCTEFENLWVADVRPNPPEAYYDKTEEQMLTMCRRFVKENPNIGALMLECTGMQPFARSVQRELGLPVFSWGTLMDYMYSVVVHREYYGHL